MPPGFTSEDFSKKKAETIPFFFLGIAANPPNQYVRTACFRKQDLSGSYCSSIFLTLPNQDSIRFRTFLRDQDARKQ